MARAGRWGGEAVDVDDLAELAEEWGVVRGAVAEGADGDVVHALGKQGGIDELLVETLGHGGVVEGEDSGEVLESGQDVVGVGVIWPAGGVEIDEALAEAEGGAVVGVIVEQIARCGDEGEDELFGDDGDGREAAAVGRGGCGVGR